MIVHQCYEAAFLNASTAAVEASGAVTAQLATVSLYTEISEATTAVDVTKALAAAANM